jgi:hypothetical protein
LTNACPPLPVLLTQRAQRRSPPKQTVAAPASCRFHTCNCLGQLLSLCPLELCDSCRTARSSLQHYMTTRLHIALHSQALNSATACWSVLHIGTSSYRCPWFCCLLWPCCSYAERCFGKATTYVTDTPLSAGVDHVLVSERGLDFPPASLCRHLRFVGFGEVVLQIGVFTGEWYSPHQIKRHKFKVQAPAPKGTSRLVKGLSHTTPKKLCACNCLRWHYPVCKLQPAYTSPGLPLAPVVLCGMWPSAGDAKRPMHRCGKLEPEEARDDVSRRSYLD